MSFSDEKNEDPKAVLLEGLSCFEFKGWNYESY